MGRLVSVNAWYIRLHLDLTVTKSLDVFDNCIYFHFLSTSTFSKSIIENVGSKIPFGIQLVKSPKTLFLQHAFETLVRSQMLNLIARNLEFYLSMTPSVT